MGGEQQKPVTEPELHGDESAALYQELSLMPDRQNRNEMTEQEPRRTLLEGLSEPTSGELKAGTEFRFLVTAAVQAEPTELGRWLYGENGTGFRAEGRPVNASLIDQDHTWTFEGGNGYILQPPDKEQDIIAAEPNDIGSSDLEPQSITYDAAALLDATSPQGYNHITIASGRLAGVFIRKTERGEELGSEDANAGLRAFAAQNRLPLVEIEVKPQDLRAGPETVERLPAKQGNRLWKIRLPEEGALREVDIIQFQPGERPKGFSVDEVGFDMRIQDIDPYGQSRYAMEDGTVLRSVLERLQALAESAEEEDKDAVEFTISRIQNGLAKLDRPD